MIDLRNYQRSAVDAIPGYFMSGKTGNPLIVAPTGSGKSVIIAKFMEESCQMYPQLRILMLSHRKELLQQNFTKLIQLWPDAPAGVYSAGLNSRQVGRNITVAGIASIYKKAHLLGWIDLILIDECHLVPGGDRTEGEGMYLKLIADLKKINRRLKVIGFTATPFRMASGMLTEGGGIFTDIAYEIEIAPLVREGHLMPLISKVPLTQADLSNVHVRGGEFVAAEAEKALDDERLTQAAIDEMEKYLSDRKSWIVFTQGVAHAHHVCAALNARGHQAEVVTGDTPDMFRAQSLNRFKSGALKVLVNCDVLTTGFDAPRTDAIILLRATQSTGLYIQICGRGMRPSPETGKMNCIVLDFAGNIGRHGPIDAIKIQRRAGSMDDEDAKEVSKAPTKVCPQCRAATPISVARCPECGYEYPAAPKHDTVASTKEIMTTFKPPKRYVVTSTSFLKHEKEGKPIMLRINYLAHEEGAEGNMSEQQFSEFVCLEHTGFAYNKAVQWWLAAHRHYMEPNKIILPMTVAEALQQTKDIRPVTHIMVQEKGKFTEVVSKTLGEWIEPEVDERPKGMTGFEDFPDVEARVDFTKSEPSEYMTDPDDLARGPWDDEEIPF